MTGSGWSPKQRGAIFAAGTARGLDLDGIRAIARDRFGVSGLSKLSREQAHQLLDVLNGKDPAQESAKRSRFSGPVRRGERAAAPKRRGGPGASTPDSRAEASAGAEDAGGKVRRDAPGKVLRPASDEQWGLMESLAFRCGFTLPKKEPGAKAYILDTNGLERWMKWKFGGAWKEIGWGEKTRRILSGTLARNVIHALRDWEKWRSRKWQKAFGRDVANAVLDAGLMNCHDKTLPEVALDELPEAIREMVKA